MIVEGRFFLCSSTIYEFRMRELNGEFNRCVVFQSTAFDIKWVIFRARVEATLVNNEAVLVTNETVYETVLFFEVFGFQAIFAQVNGHNPNLRGAVSFAAFRFTPGDFRTKKYCNMVVRNIFIFLIPNNYRINPVDAYKIAF